MSNSPTPIQSFPGPEYFKVDSAAGSRTNNTNFSCPITNDGWVLPTPANNQCTSPQCKPPNDKYYFKSNFYVYGSMLYNDTQGTQEGVLVDNSPFYYTVDGQQPFKVANKDGRFRPGGGTIEILSAQKTDTNYTYKRLKLDACNVGTTSAVATGQCFYPLTEGISNYIEKKNLSTHMTASPPNMVGGLNPLSVPEECAGKDCALFPDAAKSSPWCGYLGSEYMNQFRSCGTFPKGASPDTPSYDNIQYCGDPASRVQNSDRNWNLACPSLMLNGFQGGHWPNTWQSNSEGPVEMYGDDPDMPVAEYSYTTALYPWNANYPKSTDSTWWNAREAIGNKSNASASGETGVNLNRDRYLKIDPGESYATSSTDQFANCGGLCNNTTFSNSHTSYPSPNWPGLELGGEYTKTWGYPGCGVAGCSLSGGTFGDKACGQFCECNWNPQLPTPAGSGPGDPCSTKPYSACVQCAYGAPVSMYTDNTATTSSQKEKHDVWMSTFSWLTPEGSTTGGNPTEVGNYLEGIVLGGKS